MFLHWVPWGLIPFRADPLSSSSSRFLAISSPHPAEHRPFPVEHRAEESTMMTQGGGVGEPSGSGGSGGGRFVGQQHAQPVLGTSFAQRQGPVYVHNPNHRESPTRAEAANAIQRLQRGKLARGASQVIANLRMRDEAMRSDPKQGLAGWCCATRCTLVLFAIVSDDSPYVTVQTRTGTSDAQRGGVRKRADHWLAWFCADDAKSEAAGEARAQEPELWPQ